MAPRTPERFVDEIRQAVDRRNHETDGRTDLVRRRLSTVVTRCGWSRRSAQRLLRLQDLLEKSGVYPFPDVDDPDLDLDTYIRFSSRSRADRPLGRIFGREPALQRFIVKYHVDVFGDVPGLDGLEYVGKQIRLADAPQEIRADLIFRDGNGMLVVVELKRGDPELGAANQLREYMDLARRSNPSVRGILITAKPRTDRLERHIRADLESQSDLYPITWYWYSVDVALEPA